MKKTSLEDIWVLDQSRANNNILNRNSGFDTAESTGENGGVNEQIAPKNLGKQKQHTKK